MHNLAVYMPYIQRESLQDMLWWNKTRKDVINDVDCVTNFRNFLWLLQHNDNAKRCQIAAYTNNKNVCIGIFASHIDIDTISFKIYNIILKCNIFKVTVEPKTWNAAEKVHLGFKSDLLFIWIILFKEDTFNFNNFKYYYVTWTWKYNKVKLTLKVW